MFPSFRTAPQPLLVAGEQVFTFLPDWLAGQGHGSILLCTGGSSLERSGNLSRLLEALELRSTACETARVPGEPSPALIDEITDRFADTTVSCVVAVGGGSVIDTAKAVSAMIGERRHSGRKVSVKEFLEGVGTIDPSGRRIGLAAVPTTAGTGSEATKNAVISQVGPGGFKKSLRHEQYIPDLALLDGSLAVGAPASVTAAAGLDAVTQLLEAYVSNRATPYTDLVAAEGLERAGRVLPSLVDGSGDTAGERTQMAYAAYFSGIALANANLGVVHGAAGSLGAMHDIPHGEACGTLLYAFTRQIVSSPQISSEALAKYGRAGYLLTGTPLIGDMQRGVELLLERLQSWQEQFSMKPLEAYGFTESELEQAADGAGLKETPAALTRQEILATLTERLK